MKTEIAKEKIIEIFEKVKKLYQMDENISCNKVAKTLRISRWLANSLLFLIKNKDLIYSTVLEEKINTEKDIKVGVLADLHIPYHDEFAVEIALTYLEKNKIDWLVLLGDVGDMYQVSFYDKNPERRFKLYDDREEVKGFFHYLRDRFGKIKIIFLEGNHERRLQRWLWKYNPEMASLPELTVEFQYALKEFDIEYKIKPFRIGDLRFMHGDEYKGAIHTINIARTLFLKSMSNIIFGHWHVTQEYIQKDLDGTIKGSWSIGCLSILNPEWNKINRWNHGFAIVDFYKDGFFEVKNKKIIERRVL